MSGLLFLQSVGFGFGEQPRAGLTDLSALRFPAVAEVGPRPPEDTGSPLCVAPGSESRLAQSTRHDPE
jgi:hypothetical protein